MLRLLLVAILGYVGYRAGRSFLDSVPDGFETIPSDPRSRRAKTRRAKDKN